MKEMKETKLLSDLTEMLLSNLIEFYLTLDDLVTAINEFVGSQEYVVVKKRIKISKKEVLRKDRSSESQNKKSDTSTRRDSSGFEFTETEFSQRVDEQSERERRERRDRGRSRERGRGRREREFTRTGTRTESSH